MLAFQIPRIWSPDKRVPGELRPPPAAASRTVQIARAEWIKGHNRPIIGAPMRPYVMLKESGLETVSRPMSSSSSVAPQANQSDDSVSAASAPASSTVLSSAAANDPRVTYRWRRGPKVGYCVFHPQRPGTLRDVARTFLFYCSAECLAAGFRRMPPQHYAPRPTDDELQYCPWGGGSKTWKVVCSEQSYIPKSEDRDCILSVEIIPLAGSTRPTGPSSTPAARITLMTGPCFDPESYTPPLREMLSVYGASDHIQMGLAVKLLNWNVLADVYATEQMYDYCPSWALSWDYRKHLILKQLAALDGDIVCLQEVQSDLFEADLLPAFKAMGFGHVYAAKTRGLFTNKYMSEGCCVLFRLSRFQKLEHFVLEFDKQAQERVSDPVKLTRLSRGNVALLVLLEDLRHGRRPIGVVTTHVTADVDSGDVKLWQTQCLLDNVQSWASPMRHGGALPLLICGDFNSTPDSPVYELLTTGQVLTTAAEIDDPFHVVAETGVLGHNLPLRSSYVSVVGQEAPVTNYTLRFSGTLDYICFTHNTLRGIAVSNGYPFEELSRDVALPSPTQPSDHLLCVGVFSYL